MILSLASHGFTASPALNFFDTAFGTKLKSLVDYAKVMKSQPAQETAE